jgi:hypothetical protein
MVPAPSAAQGHSVCRPFQVHSSNITGQVHQYMALLISPSCMALGKQNGYVLSTSRLIGQAFRAIDSSGHSSQVYIFITIGIGHKAYLRKSGAPFSCEANFLQIPIASSKSSQQPPDT